MSPGPNRRLEVVVDLALHVDRDAAQVAVLERRNADGHLRGLLIYGRVSALAQGVCQSRLLTRSPSSSASFS